MDGQVGANYLDGGSGNDGLVGGLGLEVLVGGDGKDDIADLDQTSDDLNGGNDNDILDAQDGFGTDIVNGGFDFDRCFADAGDQFASCEELNPRGLLALVRNWLIQPTSGNTCSRK